MLIVNASNMDKDWNWITKHNNTSATMSNVSDNYTLLAVQGPKAAEALQCLTEVDIINQKYYTFSVGQFAGIDNVIISATGYTGSGGYEIYIPNNKAIIIWDALFSNKEYDLKPVGLAARDTLRIEMGYCLYGNDINEKISPFEANLSWITKVETNFIGSNIIKAEIQKGLKRKLVGFKLLEKSIPRNGYEIYSIEKKIIGKVTSGTFSPILKIGIGLAYIDNEYLEEKIIYIKIRENFVKAEIFRPPFI